MLVWQIDRIYSFIRSWDTCCCSSSSCSSFFIFAFIYLVILLWDCSHSWILPLLFVSYPTALTFRIYSAVNSFLFPLFLIFLQIFFWPILGGPQWDNWNSFSRVRYTAPHNVLLIVHYYFTGHVPTFVIHVLQMYVTCPSTKIDERIHIRFWLAICYSIVYLWLFIEKKAK